MLQNLSIPITTDVDATQARAQPDEEHIRLLVEATMLATTQRRLEFTRRVCDATYGFTPAAAEPNRVARGVDPGGAIGRTLGVGQPVYDTRIKNMRAAEGPELLQGEELQQWL